MSVTSLSEQVFNEGKRSTNAGREVFAAGHVIKTVHSPEAYQVFSFNRDNHGKGNMTSIIQDIEDRLKIHSVIVS